MTRTLFDGRSVQVAKLTDLIEIPSGGIVSKPVLETDTIKLVLFALDAEQVLSEHSAPFVALVHMLDGVVRFRVHGVDHTLKAHDWLVMPADAPHSVIAERPSRLLLTLVKDGRATGESRGVELSDPPVV